jgi:hypothetical protein
MPGPHTLYQRLRISYITRRWYEARTKHLDDQLAQPVQALSAFPWVRGVGGGAKNPLAELTYPDRSVHWRLSVVTDMELHKNPTPIRFDETLWPAMIEIDKELARYLRTNAERYAMWLKAERQRGQ